MPYQPSQTDRSGQIRGQGIAAFGQSVAEGLSGAFEAYNKNKMLTAQSTAKFEAAVNANKDLAAFLDSDKAPADAAKAFAKLHKDGAVGLKDSAVLAQFADSYTAQKQQQQEAAMRDQQAKLYQQQAAEFAQRIEMQKKQAQDEAAAQRALASAAKLDNPPAGSAIPGAVDAATFAGSSFESAMAAGAPVQAQQKRSAADIARRFMESGAPITPNVERFLNASMQADDRAAAVDQRASAAEARSAAAIAAAEARATTATDKLENAKGKHSKMSDAIKEGIDSLKAGGAAMAGSQLEIVPMAGGTYMPKIVKPYAAHDSTAQRVIDGLHSAADKLEMAEERGDEKEIAKAKFDYDFWTKKAKKESEYSPNGMAQFAEALAAIDARRRGVAPTPAPAPVVAPAPASRVLTPRDQAALDWAKANPNDPRAAAIKAKLGIK